MPETAIVILNWNGIEFLKKFLGLVVRYSESPDTVVYVADNGSTDGSVEWIIENQKSVRIIRFEKNHGFAAGYNYAFSQIEAKYYLLLNSDIEVTADWLEPLLGHMESHPETAAIQPKILSWSKRDHFEYAGASGGYIDRYGYPFCRGRIFDNIEKDNGQYNDVVRVFWASGACFLIRAEAWKRCGGFDPAFFAHMEEIDLCWRLNNAGYLLACVPSSIVYHVGGGTLPYNSSFKTFLNFRNSLFLLYKNLDQKDLKRIMFIRKLLDGVAAFFFLLKGHPASSKAVFDAHMNYYRNIDELKSRRSDSQKLKNGVYSATVLNKSIVFEFYARGRKTYNQLLMPE
jgi:GT2 family glycosyltransferase